MNFISCFPVETFILGVFLLKPSLALAPLCTFLRLDLPGDLYDGVIKTFWDNVERYNYFVTKLYFNSRNKEVKCTN